VNLGQRIYRVIRSFIAPRSRSAFGAMPYTEFTFAALGRVAKAAGVIQPAHIEVAQRLIRDLGFGATDRRHASDVSQRVRIPLSILRRWHAPAEKRQTTATC